MSAKPADTPLEECVGDLPTETLEAEIATLYSRISAETCRWLLLVGEYDRREQYLRWGCRSCAHWLSWHCGIAVRVAQEQVRVARRLADLPLIRESFAAGKLSYSKVRALSRIAEPDSEAQLLEVARNATAAQLERVASAYRCATTAPDPESLRNGRYASFQWDDDGCLNIRARLTPEEGAAFMKALDAARDELFRERGDDVAAAERGDARPIRESRVSNADTLARLAESALASDDSRASGGDATQVVVHVDAGELATRGAAEGRTSPGRCELEDGPGIHSHTARRLACDASIVTLVERDGEPLSVGRKTRSIPPAVRRALRARDGGCRFPGCSANRFIDAHHIKHWADGGKTELSNLVNLCRHHHRLIHEGRFRIEAGADGGLLFLWRNGGQPLPASPELPGARPKPRTAQEAAEATPSEAERNGTPLGPCAPPHGRQPVDLELTTWVLCQDHERKKRSRPNPGVKARAGP